MKRVTVGMSCQVEKRDESAIITILFFILFFFIHIRLLHLAFFLRGLLEKVKEMIYKITE